MIRIGLLSDTHGFTDPKLAEVFKDVDEIWHAGDIGSLEVCHQLSKIKPLYAVYGNIDGREIRAEYPENLIFMREGLSIVITHIGGYPGNYSSKSRKLILDHQPDIFVCGHSHILKVMRDPKYNLLAINPGAAGVQGFHPVKTVLRFVLNSGKIEQLEAIELGPRGIM